MPHSWMPIRTYTRRLGAEWHELPAWDPKLKPGLFEHKGLSRAFFNVQEVPWVRHNSVRYWEGPGTGLGTRERKAAATRGVLF